jgi:hypothetical protein
MVVAIGNFNIEPEMFMKVINASRLSAFNWVLLCV